MLLNKKPDIIISGDQKVIGFKNSDNKLELYGNYIPEFMRKYWVNWFGQGENIYKKIDFKKEGLSLLTQNKKKINVNFRSKDCNADIVFNMIKKYRCPNKKVYDPFFLKSNGTILLFCADEEGECYLETYKSKRFEVR